MRYHLWRQRVENLKRHAYKYYSRGDACRTCLISLHTPFISKLFISTVSYSVKVYGPDTEPENIRSMAVRIDGEDGTQTELKYLTNKATEGYECVCCLQPNWRGSGLREEGNFESYHCTCLCIKFLV